MVRFVRGVVGLGVAAASTADTWTFANPGSVKGANVPHISSGAAARVQEWPQMEAEFAQAAASETAQGDWFGSMVRWVGAGFAAGIVAAAVSSSPAEAYTNGKDAWNPARNFDPSSIAISKRKNLEKCVDNKKFHKRIKDTIYKQTNRQKKYPKDGAVWNRFQKRINQIKRREESYGERYCGKKDGLPRVLINPDVRRGGVVIPALMFLYSAGWIGWTGRTYLMRTQDVDGSAKEIIIDVPLALQCIASGFAWPVNAWQDIVNGEMVEKDENIHRSYF